MLATLKFEVTSIGKWFPDHVFSPSSTQNLSARLDAASEFMRIGNRGRNGLAGGLRTTRQVPQNGIAIAPCLRHTTKQATLISW